MYKHHKDGESINDKLVQFSKSIGGSFALTRFINRIPNVMCIITLRKQQGFVNGGQR